MPCTLSCVRKGEGENIRLSLCMCIKKSGKISGYRMGEGGNEAEDGVAKKLLNVYIF